MKSDSEYITINDDVTIDENNKIIVRTIKNEYHPCLTFLQSTKTILKTREFTDINDLIRNNIEF